MGHARFQVGQHWSAGQHQGCAGAHADVVREVPVCGPPGEAAQPAERGLPGQLGHGAGLQAQVPDGGAQDPAKEGGAQAPARPDVGDAEVRGGRRDEVGRADAAGVEPALLLQDLDRPAGDDPAHGVADERDAPARRRGQPPHELRQAGAAGCDAVRGPAAVDVHEHRAQPSGERALQPPLEVAHLVRRGAHAVLDDDEVVAHGVVRCGGLGGFPQTSGSRGGQA
mmetsp:Transcript_48391/g.136772  ORF Transcript_48391/g.136772 Transcript_48391/m.136772 type:complete len:225 (-) Transcript_48391:17-691(-)